MNLSEIKRILAEYFANKPVRKAWVFGSYSRNEQRADSDIDILIDLDRSRKVGLEFFGMFEDLRKLLGIPVDFVTTQSLAAFAHQEVNKDKVLVYERAE